MKSIADIPLIILAGGRATRLGALSVDLPKYLMKVSPQKCFADIHLEWAYQKGFRKVILCIGYLGDQVRNYCGNGQKYGLEIEYLDDGPKALGTGGSVRQLLNFEKSNWNLEHFALTYGDTLLKIDIEKMWLNLAQSQNALVSMSIFKNSVAGHICNCQPSTEGFRYSKSNPKPDWEYIDYGFLIFNHKALDSFSSELPLDLAKPLEELSFSNKVIDFIVNDRFWEIGSPNSLEEFQQKFKEN